MMKLADGIDFRLGMTVYLPLGESDEYRTIQTDAELHAVETLDYRGQRYHCIGMKASGLSTDLRQFYSSPAAIVQRRIDDWQSEINERQAEIVRLRTLQSN